MLTDRISHGWQVLGVLLLGASGGVAAWGLSQAGLLDLAATGTAFWLTTMVRLTGGGWLGRLPEFAGTATLVAQARADLSAWLASRKLLSLALIALGMTVAFLGTRAVTAWVLGIVASPWLALALGLGVAAFVAAPTIGARLGRIIGGSQKEREGEGGAA